jgi:hypothetical protein
MAMFVILLLTVMGTSLLVATQTEVKMGRADGTEEDLLRVGSGSRGRARDPEDPQCGGGDGGPARIVRR